VNTLCRRGEAVRAPISQAAFLSRKNVFSLRRHAGSHRSLLSRSASMAGHPRLPGGCHETSATAHTAVAAAAASTWSSGCWRRLDSAAPGRTAALLPRSGGAASLQQGRVGSACSSGRAGVGCLWPSSLSLLRYWRRQRPPAHRHHCRHPPGVAHV